MKNITIILFSLLAIASGISGYVYLNKSAPIRDNFDATLSIDDKSFKDSGLETSKRISAFKRLAQKRDNHFRLWVLENFDELPLDLKEVALEEIGSFFDEQVNTFLLKYLSEPQFKLASLKGLGRIENESRAKILKRLDVSAYNSTELNQFHFSSFKANIYFSQKKLSLIYLINKAKEIKDGSERESIINFLAISVPNFERLHELLKDLMFSSRSPLIVNRAIIHLAVYETSWMKIQMKKVLSSKNEVLIRAYLDRVGAVCPIEYWKTLSDNFLSNKQLVLEYAFKMNTQKAVEFTSSRLKQTDRLYSVFKKRFSENIRLCY